MKYVVYLTDQPFDLRNYDRFGIRSWADHGWRVEVWDLTPLCHPAVWRAFLEAGRTTYACPEYISIASVADLAARISAAKGLSYYIDFAGSSFHAGLTKLRLSQRGASRVMCSVGSIPWDFPSGALSSKWRRVLTPGKAESRKWLAEGLLARMTNRFAPPRVAVVSGRQSLSAWPTPVPQQVVKAHNLDFDLFLRLRGEPKEHAGNYVVFLDQDVCFHPEYDFEKIPKYATPEKYFPAIRCALAAAADRLGLEVRIAAHPRATYDRNPGAFYGTFPIVQNATAELIRDSALVMSHATTAVQFAVLFDKPVAFVTTDELEHSPMGPPIHQFASAMGKRAINIDTELDAVNWPDELAVDPARYVEYRDRYIKFPGSPERPHWDIVRENFESAGDPR